MRKLSTHIRRDLELRELKRWTPDPSLPVPRPLPSLVDEMNLHDDMRTLGKVYARQEQRPRMQNWKHKTNSLLVRQTQRGIRLDPTSLLPLGILASIGHARGS